MSKLTLHVATDPMTFRQPLRIAGHVFTGIPAVRVRLEGGGIAGRGEASGVYYTGDTLDHMQSELEAYRPLIEDGPSREELRRAMPAGGAGIPIAADESLLGLEDIAGLVGRFQVANIKLDKCGGLTEALDMEAFARKLGLGVMVGNMAGSSLAAAPAFLLGQLCDFVDLDGPAFIAADLPEPVSYRDGRIHCPPNLWGAAWGSVTA
ncbi:mandelate racemase/muconate lactonizing enzyme [Sphingomonas sp. LH128]|uniref:enolase C-terminal domain-like protein n=1 Tax=Sphingomonas sp. LH128 TaxID=473781 RepID=UPI00027C9B02|nr:enolase C-terminal domain-like protein [Sphingomonas sp. LH128]EJU14769.1 mandelate racemase/muconate lactonizing enzyme [Sphingomonas sp. LH128]